MGGVPQLIREGIIIFLFLFSVTVCINCMGKVLVSVTLLNSSCQFKAGKKVHVNSCR